MPHVLVVHEMQRCQPQQRRIKCFDLCAASFQLALHPVVPCPFCQAFMSWQLLIGYHADCQKLTASGAMTLTTEQQAMFAACMHSPCNQALLKLRSWTASRLCMDGCDAASAPPLVDFSVLLHCCLGAGRTCRCVCFPCLWTLP